VNDLRTRIVVLAGLIALVTALVCSIAADMVARRNLKDYENDNITIGIACLHRQIDDLLAYLSFEVQDYACWDELYQNMPQPSKAWAAINLAPGRSPGCLTQVMVVGERGVIQGRFRNQDQRATEPNIFDPAEAAAVSPLLNGDAPFRGVAILGGHPALYACAPVLTSDRSGPARGHLLCLAYFNEELVRRCEVHGFSLRMTDMKSGPASADGVWTLGSPVIVRENATLCVDVPMQVRDGTMTVRLTMDETRRKDGHLTLVIISVGLGVAVLASLLGGLLGWWWLRPIERLAEECRRVGKEDIELSSTSGLREADQLAALFNQRLATERHARVRLGEALDREATSHAVQRRFLSHLGQELGQPLQRTIALIDGITASSSPQPEQLSEIRQCAVALEERFQEILGQVSDSMVEGRFGAVMSPRRFVEGLCDQLRPRAQAKGLALNVIAPESALFIPLRLLTPVLVNLLSNALRATNAGSITITVQCQADGGTTWQVQDTGPGMAADLAARIADCCRHGEVIPGTPGIGLGLTLALAHVRSLNGRIELIDNGPQGVGFRVSLPSMG
jgi:signal transduction histidine kinase/sensor domain CHASE-containing protein